MTSVHRANFVPKNKTADASTLGRLGGGDKVVESSVVKILFFFDRVELALLRDGHFVAAKEEFLGRLDLLCRQQLLLVPDLLLRVDVDGKVLLHRQSDFFKKNNAVMDGVNHDMFERCVALQRQCFIELGLTQLSSQPAVSRAHQQQVIVIYKGGMDQLRMPIKLCVVSAADALDGWDAFLLEYDDVADSAFYHVYLTLMRTK